MASTLFKVDRSGNIIVSTELSADEEIISIVFTGKKFWVLNRSTPAKLMSLDRDLNTLVEIDISTLNDEPQGLEYYTRLFWMDGNTGTFEIHKQTGEKITSRSTLPQNGSIEDITFDGSNMWIAAGSVVFGLMLYNRQGDQILSRSMYSSPEAPVGIAFDGNFLWLIRSFGSILVQTDRQGNKIKDIDLSASIPDPKGMCFDGRHLYILDAAPNGGID